MNKKIKVGFLFAILIMIGLCIGLVAVKTAMLPPGKFQSDMDSIGTDPDILFVQEIANKEIPLFFSDPLNVVCLIVGLAILGCFAWCFVGFGVTVKTLIEERD